MGQFGRFADLCDMSKFEYKHLSHHFQFTSQERKMNATDASVERVQKYVFNFETYRFLKNRPICPILPYAILKTSVPVSSVSTIREVRI